LNGDVHWPDTVHGWIKNFLVENFNRDTVFANRCKGFWGEQLFNKIRQEDVINFADLTSEELQNFIMVIVPKLIARFVHNDGWRVQTEKNLRYGGGEHAPMITWIVRFTWDAGATATPDALYRYALFNIFSGVGLVTDDGDLILR
jgi:hypothetical protein